MRNFTLLATLGLAACGGGFSQGEAEQIMEDLNAINQEAYTSMSTEVATAGRAVSGNFEWDLDEDSATFSGDLTSDGTAGGFGFGAGWAGTLEMDGSVTWTDTKWTWDLGVTYVDVEVEGTTYNGSTDWSMTVDVGDGTSYTLSYTLTGEVTAEGEIKGTGEVDWTTTMTFDESGLSMEASGTIGKQTVEYEYSFGGF